VNSIETYSLLMPLAIFLARVTDVSIGTVRTILVLRGRKYWAVGLGFIESMIWISAASFVLSSLDQWTHILAYCAGFATGNFIGITIESRLAIGFQAVHCVSRHGQAPVSNVLSAAGWHVTTYQAELDRQPAEHCVVVTPRRQASQVMALARNADPGAIISIEEVRHFSGGALPCPLERPMRAWTAGHVPATRGAPDFAA
jgi:uncharacterized protein YebE (UPF0316 family)